ncbi:unnamed protein product, partial [marine sediment metagenome]
TTQAQVLEKPNFGMSSHPTLELDKIEFTGVRTLLYFSIVNKRLGGTFCIDRNTCLRNSLGQEEYQLIEMANIPACPESYRFRSIGETLSFILHFPEISEEIKYIDLVEDCEDACVSVKYISLDAEINRRINEGFTLYEAGRLDQALAHFEGIMNDKSDNYYPVFGTLYLYLITVISYDLRNSEELKRWYNELKSSSVINRDEIIKSAREEGLVR